MADEYPNTPFRRISNSNSRSIRGAFIHAYSYRSRSDTIFLKPSYDLEKLTSIKNESRRYYRIWTTEKGAFQWLKNKATGTKPKRIAKDVVGLFGEDFLRHKRNIGEAHNLLPAIDAIENEEKWQQIDENIDRRRANAQNILERVTKPQNNKTNQSPEKFDKLMVDGSLQENMASIPQKQQIMSYRFKNTGQSYTTGGAATMPIMPGGSGYWNYVVVGAFDDFVQLPAKTWDFTAPKVASGFKTLKGALVLDGPANGFNFGDVAVMFVLDNPSLRPGFIQNGQARRYYSDTLGLLSGAVTMHAEMMYRSGGGNLMRYGLGFNHLQSTMYNNIHQTGALMRHYGKTAPVVYLMAKKVGVEGTKAAATYAAVKAGVAAKVTAPVATVYTLLLSPQFMQGNAAERVNGQRVPSKSVNWLKPITNPLNVRGIVGVMVNGKDGGKPVNLTPEQQARDFNIQRMISTGQLQLQGCMMAPRQNILLQK